MDPLTLGSLIVSGASAANKAIQGYRQQRDARRAMAGLQEPTIEVPAALRQRAQEPIAEQIMTAQAEEQARRTGQSVGALQKAGARGIIGGLGGVMDAERRFERNRMANYEQERRGALGELGAAQRDVQAREMQNYLQKIQASQRGLEAGQQNVAGALDTASQFGQQLLSAKLQGLIPNSGGGSTEVPTGAVSTPQATPQAADISGMPESIAPNDTPIMGPMPQRGSAPSVSTRLPQSAGGGSQPSLRTETIGPTLPQDSVGGVQVPSISPRGLNRTPMSAPDMGGIRTGQLPAQQAEDFMDAYQVGTQGRTAYEPIQTPSARRLRRLRMQQPNMGGLRVNTPSEYARALEILKRI